MHLEFKLNLIFNSFLNDKLFTIIELESLRIFENINFLKKLLDQPVGDEFGLITTFKPKILQNIIQIILP